MCLPRPCLYTCRVEFVNHVFKTSTIAKNIRKNTHTKPATSENCQVMIVRLTLVEFFFASVGLARAEMMNQSSNQKLKSEIFLAIIRRTTAKIVKRSIEMEMASTIEDRSSILEAIMKIMRLERNGRHRYLLMTRSQGRCTGDETHTLCNLHGREPIGARPQEH